MSLRIEIKQIKIERNLKIFNFFNFGLFRKLLIKIKTSINEFDKNTNIVEIINNFDIWILSSIYKFIDS